MFTALSSSHTISSCDSNTTGVSPTYSAYYFDLFMSISPEKYMGEIYINKFYNLSKILEKYEKFMSHEIIPFLFLIFFEMYIEVKID